MSDVQSELNGGIDMLAQGLRDVIGEAMAGVRKGMHADMKMEVSELRKDMDAGFAKLDKRIDTTNENMQAQFAEQESKFAEEFKQVRAMMPESASGA